MIFSRSACRRTGSPTFAPQPRTPSSNSRLTCRPRPQNRCCSSLRPASSTSLRPRRPTLTPTLTRCGDSGSSRTSKNWRRRSTRPGTSGWSSSIPRSARSSRRTLLAPRASPARPEPARPSSRCIGPSGSPNPHPTPACCSRPSPIRSPLRWRRRSRLLAGPETSVIPRIRVASLQGVAAELLELATGRRAHVAKDDQIARALENAAADAGLSAEAEFPALRMGACRRRLAGDRRGRISRRAAARARQAAGLEAARNILAGLRRRPRRPGGARLLHLAGRLHRRDAPLRRTSRRSPFRISSSTRRKTSASQNCASSPQSRPQARTICSSPAISASASSSSLSPGRRSASTSAAAPRR